MNDLAPAPESLVEWGEIEEPRVPQRLFALKDRDTFMVADSHGDIEGASDGLFHDDTRILSRWELRLGDRSSTLLSGAVSQDNVYFTSHGLNRAIPVPAGPAGPPGVVHLERKRFLWDERLYERVRLTNYDSSPIRLPVSFLFAADFRDMFEVRGARRRARGRTFGPDVGASRVRFRYDGLDGVTRTSVVAFSEPPGVLTELRADFDLDLRSDECVEIFVEVGAGEAAIPSRPVPRRRRPRALRHA